MARWKPLPEGLDPLVVQFVAELRRLKDDSGLSLKRLAKKTGFSASSWERYLGGRAFAPEGAVAALAAEAGADEANLLVVHHMARQAWIAAGEPEPAESGPAESEPAGSSADAEGSTARVGTAAAMSIAGGIRRRIPPLRTVGPVLAAAMVGSALTVLAIQPWQGTKTALRPAAKTVPTHYECRFTQIDGRWFAGNSTTDTAAVTYGMSGSDVAELQCLLQHAGHSPGAIDGNFGPNTLRAVIQEQYTAHIDLDGQVGSQTWGKLRG